MQLPPVFSLPSRVELKSRQAAVMLKMRTGKKEMPSTMHHVKRVGEQFLFFQCSLSRHK